MFRAARCRARRAVACAKCVSIMLVGQLVVVAVSLVCPGPPRCVRVKKCPLYGVVRVMFSPRCCEGQDVCSPGLAL